MSNESALLGTLARRAGLAVDWENAQHEPQHVADAVLRTLLGKLGLPAADDAQVRASLALLDAEAPSHRLPPMLTAELGSAIALPPAAAQSGTRYRIELEHGGTIDGKASGSGDQPVLLPPVAEPGYHTLCIGAQRCTLAIAPPRCFTVADAWAARAQPAAPAQTRESTARDAAATPAAPRLWGIGAQVYGLRRPADGGAGDYTALAELARAAAARGAHALAISPVHAMFSAQPEKFSPYSPSSRLFLNVLHIDFAATFGAATLASAIADLQLGDELARLEQLELIDWPAVARTRLALGRWLFARFRQPTAHHTDVAKPAPDVVGTPELVDSFDAFCDAGGQALEDHARFEALLGWRMAECSAQRAAADGGTRHDANDPLGNLGNGGAPDIAHAAASHEGDGSYWRLWPTALQDPRSDAVAAFAAQHRDEVDFYLFMQWLAQRGVAGAQQAARAAGMAVGLIADLAVGCDSAGSHAWSYRDDMLQGVSVGAPPDIFNQAGQAWGLTTFSPRAMLTQGFSAFIDMLRATFAHAGGARIDHILGLRRLWLVPDGASARDGAYLHYPFDDMLRLIALESWRHRAIVIGEDLGTVPAGFRDRLAEAALLGIRVLWFEREEHSDAFTPARRWSAAALATTTTHDLPTVAGWWRGADIEWRARIGQTDASDPAALAREHGTREQDKQRLWQALLDAGVTPGGAAGGALDASLEVPTDAALDATSASAPAAASAIPDDAPIDAALAFVGSTPAPLVSYPLEDLLGLVEQPNLPGSTDEHPNWRRRMPAATATLLDQPDATRRLALLAHLREPS